MDTTIVQTNPLPDLHEVEKFDETEEIRSELAPPALPHRRRRGHARDEQPRGSNALHASGQDLGARVPPANHYELASRQRSSPDGLCMRQSRGRGTLPSISRLTRPHSLIGAQATTTVVASSRKGHCECEEAHRSYFSLADHL